MSQGFALLGNPRVRYWDVNGTAPLSLGKMHFYISGGSTPQDTWQDAALASKNTNPLTLSVSGQGTVFVPAATLYRVDLYDANGVQQEGYPIDGVEPIPAPDPPAPTPSPVATGSCVWSPYATVPSGFLYCNGALISRVTYSALNTIAAANGYPDGSGDGATTFALPDIRGRAPYGLAASGTGSTPGGTFGLMDHTHTGPSHTHSVAVDWTHVHNVTVAAHQHNVTCPGNGWLTNAVTAPSVAARIVLGDGATTFTQPTADNVVASAANGAINQNTGAASVTSNTFTSSASGTGATGIANPPGIAGYWFIKT